METLIAKNWSSLFHCSLPYPNNDERDKVNILSPFFFTRSWLEAEGSNPMTYQNGPSGE